MVKALSHDHNYHHEHEESVPEGDMMHDQVSFFFFSFFPFSFCRPSTQRLRNVRGSGGRSRLSTRSSRRMTATRTV
jgi:hypothetical protein